MPTLDINGTQVSVDDSFLKLSHDEQNATVNEIASSMSSPKPEGSSLSGVAKSLGTGLAQGAIGIAGIPGDLAALNMKLAGREASPGMGSEDIQKRIEQYTGDFYKPKGTAEEIASKIGQFAPAAIGGPETLATKALTRVVAPALASEAGGAVAGPYGELAGALAGGAGATAAARKFQAMAAAKAATPAITADQALKTAGDQFNAARDMNVTVKPDFATNAAADMRSAVKNYDPEVIKSVHGAADRLENLGASGPGLPPVAVQMNDAENIRKQLVSLKTNPDASIRSAAKDAIKSLQQSQMALAPADVLSGDAGAYRNLVSDAVGNWAKGKQAQTVLGKIDLGNLNADTAGAGANGDNAIRQAIKQLARPVNNTNLPKWKQLGMSDAVGAQIDKTARGTLLGNTARYIGKAAPTGIVSAGLGAEAGHIAGGPLGAVALPAVGYIAKKIGDLSTKKAANAITSLILSESPLAAQVASQLPPQLIQQLPSKAQITLQRLILADPTLAQQARQPVSQSNPY